MQAFKRFLNRLFPVHTHCGGCGEKLDEPSRIVTICQTCGMW
jgi:hypothetical protein